MSNYDEVPYPDFIHPVTHPGNIAAIARLNGLDAVPPESCRVLELACGPGGNLISLASLLPNSQFEGVDLAAGHIKTGNAVIAKLGLNNIQLKHGNIEDWAVEPQTDDERFDYIIAHGVYCWVPDAVRQSILAICQMRLSERGVALISYNTYPGWHQREMARDIMRYHAEGIDDPLTRLRHGKALLSSVMQNVPQGSAYRLSLEEELKALEQANQAYVFHEQFEDTNEPRYFHQFAAEASSHLLQYIAEAEWGDTTYEYVRPDVARALASLPKTRRAQTLDYFRRRTFRQTLVCHESATLSETLQSSEIETMHLASTSTMQDGQLTGSNGLSGSVGHPVTQIAMQRLIELYPRTISFEELCHEVKSTSPDFDTPEAMDDLKADLFELVCVGLVTVSASSVQPCCTVSTYPHVAELAREQARTGETVTNLWHQPIRLDDVTAHLVRCCDGKTDHAGLIEQMTQYAMANGGLVEGDQVVTGEERLRPLVSIKMQANLQRLAGMALLIA